MAGLITAILCDLSGGCAPTTPTDDRYSGLITPQDVARATTATEYGASPSSPASGFAPLFREVSGRLDLGAFDNAVPFASDGYGLTYARNGSAPNGRIRVGFGAGVSIVLAPGESIRGRFTSFSIQRASYLPVGTVNQQFRVVVDALPDARYLDTNGDAPAFPPVQLMAETVLAVGTSPWSGGSILPFIGTFPQGFKTVRVIIRYPPSSPDYVNAVFTPIRARTPGSGSTWNKHYPTVAGTAASAVTVNLSALQDRGFFLLDVSDYGEVKTANPPPAYGAAAAAAAPPTDGLFVEFTSNAGARTSVYMTIEGVE